MMPRTVERGTCMAKAIARPDFPFHNGDAQVLSNRASTCHPCECSLAIEGHLCRFIKYIPLARNDGNSVAAGHAWRTNLVLLALWAKSFGPCDTVLIGHIFDVDGPICANFTLSAAPDPPLSLII